MTSPQLFFLAGSVAGAVFLFLGGYVAARSRKSAVAEPVDSDEENQALLQQLRAASERESQQATELKALREWKTASETERSGHDQAINQLQAQIAGLTRERDQARQQVQSAPSGDAHQRLNQENTSLKARLASLTQELDRCRQQTQVTEAKELQQLNQQVAQLRAELATVTRERDQARHQQAQSASTQGGEVKNLQQQVTQLRGQSATLTQERDLAAKRIRALEREVEDLRTAKEYDHPEQTIVASDTPAVQIVQLEQGLKEAQDAQKRTEQERNSLRDANSRLKQELEKTRTELQLLQGQQARETSDRTAALEAQLRDSTNKLQAVQAELQAVRGHQTEDAIQKVAGLQAQLEARTRELEAARQSNTAAHEKAAGLQRTVEQLHAREQELTRQVAGTAEAHQQLEGYRSRLAEADNKLAQLGRLEEERYQLREKIRELEEKTGEIKKLQILAEERQDLVMRIEVLKQKEAELEVVRDEKMRLADQLNAVLSEKENLSDQVKTLEGVEDERKDLAIKAEVLSEQTGQLEQLREENLLLRSRLHDVESLQEKLAALNAENVRLRSMTVVTATPPRPVLTAKPENFAESLQALLDRLSQDENARGAVMADELGLMVAGAGEYAEALAGVAAFFTDMDNKVQAMLPLQALQRLVLVDGNSLTIAAQPVMTSSGKLFLTTLSAGPGPDGATIDRLIAETVIQAPDASPA